MKLQRNPDPCQQFFNGKRLRNIIHRSGIQSRHLVHHRIPGGQKDHRRRIFRAEAAQDFDPVDPRQHDIQQDQIKPL